MMNIAITLYTGATGLANIIPSIIGQEIGKGNLKEAKSYLSVIRWTCSIYFIGLTMVVYKYNSYFISLLTNLPDVAERADKITPLLILNTFPESMKCM